MKLKYIIPLLMAVVAAVVTSCSDSNDPTYLSQIRVSQSYVGFPAQGGSATITLNTVDSWQIADELPDWVSASALSGGAGQSDLVLTAEPATESRDASFAIECAGVKQTINLIQVTEKTEAPLVPISTVLNGNDGTTYRVRGVVATNPDNQYGNWDIEDETGRVYIYGTFDQKGGKGTYPISGTNGWGFEVGDIVTVEGPRSVYNGTIELVDVTVINIEKSLIKADSIMVAGEKGDVLPLEGADFEVRLTNKGNGITVDVPAAAQSWLSVMGVETANGTATVKFRAAANTGGDRSTTLVFKTTDNAGKEYTSEATISQKGAILEVPVSEFLAAEVGDTQFRMTGVVTELYTSDTQGQSFYLKDYSGQTLVYRAAGFKESGAKVGDVVTVVGKRGAYRETAQLTSGTFEELKYSVTEVSIAEFLTKPDDKGTYYMVTGTIKSLLGSNGKENDYGNLYITDGTNELYVYGCYSGYGATGDARKFFIKNNGIAEGDELTMIGYKDTYNGLVELCGGICFSFAKSTAVHGESAQSPFTVAEAIAKCQAIGATSDGVVYFAKGKVSSIKEISTSYGNGTFNISDDGTDANALTVYRAYSLGNQKFAAEDEVKVGDEVIVTGKLVNYTDKNGVVTPEFSGSVYVYSINGKTE